MKILSIVGARPQFVKLAPIASALAARSDGHVIVHTGQHYDVNMSDVFFRDLGIPSPDVHLGVGSGSHGRQTGAILAAMDEVLESHHPDWVLVYGDTNSTLAGALSAVKLHLPLAHLEAGLRSFNRRMPEEHNRVLTDHAADLCLAPTEVALSHLSQEGLADRSVVVGDVMVDVCLDVSERHPGRLASVPEGDYVVATIHRAESTDSAERLAQILTGLHSIEIPVVLTAHPRLVAKAAEHQLDLARGNVSVIPPLAYPDMVKAVREARAVVTDSGGLQKESFLLGTPCVTIRTETEWPETVELGWNTLASDAEGLNDLVRRPQPGPPTSQPYGVGTAAANVVTALRDRAPTN